MQQILCGKTEGLRETINVKQKKPINLYQRATGLFTQGGTDPIIMADYDVTLVMKDRSGVTQLQH